MPRPKTEAAEYGRLTLRLPQWLLQALKEEAESERRPINTQAVLILEKWYATKKRRAKKE